MRDKFFKALIVLLLLFQFQDALCTYIGVTNFGLFLEANPIIKWSMESLGAFWGLAVPKLLTIVFIMLIYDTIDSSKVTGRALGVLIFVNIVYAISAYRWLDFLSYQGLL